jgi:subtilase family serine protease
VADPATGVAVYDSNCTGVNLYLGNCFSGWGVVGGTSVSSPIIASVYALAGNAASVTYGSYGYSHTEYLNDITTGSNGTCSPAYLCTAEPGYDGPTGNGTPNGVGAF